MQTPPKPQESEPLQHFLWEKKAELLDWTRTLRNGAFKQKITLSMDLSEAYIVLLSSPLFPHDEKRILGKIERTSDVHQLVFGIIGEGPNPEAIYQDFLTKLTKRISMEKWSPFYGKKMMAIDNTTRVVSKLEGDRIVKSTIPAVVDELPKP